MNGVLKLNGMMQFSRVGEKKWGKLDYLGGAIFIDPSQCEKFTGSGILKEVELGVSLTSSASGTGIRVETVLGVQYGK